jgi:hypothetical protein
MAEIQITGLVELQRRLATAAQHTPQLVRQILFRHLTNAVTFAKTTYLTGGTTADRLAVRTGALRASFGMEVQQSGTPVSARIGYILPQVNRGGGDPLVYARIHEGWPEGRASTTVVPRTSKFLAIPLQAAKTPAGVPRGRPRDFPNTFIRRSRQGNLLIFQKTGKTTIIPLFVLKSEVVIPARPALRKTMHRFTPVIVDALGKAIAGQLGG